MEPTRTSSAAGEASIETRVANIERMLVRIETQLDQLPGLAAMAGDSFDEAARRAQERGIDLDGRLDTAVHLLETLTRPEVAGALQNAADLATSAPPTAAAAIDTIDELVAGLQARGMDIDERLSVVLRLAERLSDPNIASTLDKLLVLLGQSGGTLASLLDTLDEIASAAQGRGVDFEVRLRGLVEFVEKVTRPAALKALSKAADIAVDAPGLVGTMLDTFDDIAAGLSERGVDVQERLDKLLSLAEKASAPGALDALHHFLKNAEVMRLLADAMANSSEREPPALGLFGMARALRNANAKVALGFTATLLDHFGESLRNRTAGKNLLE
jgi:uncharacterized protein YjgD (DUF1641 family)